MILRCKDRSDWGNQPKSWVLEVLFLMKNDQIDELMNEYVQDNLYSRPKK